MARLKSLPIKSKRFCWALIIAVLVVSNILFMIHPSVDALTIQNRSVAISSSVPSAITNEQFQFTYPSTNIVGSMVFKYCDNAALISLPCTAPPGFDASGVSLVSQTGNTGFSVYAPGTNANTVTLTRAALAGAIQPSTYNLGNIVNPSDSNHTVYVRISIYSSTDGSGSYNDNGSVAFSTTVPLSVNVSVPPFMDICVGITVSSNCTTIAGSTLDLGILKTTQTKYGTSQLSVGTNSASGYVMYVLGTTLTSGNNTISVIHPAAPSQIGTNQFGLNLIANTAPSIGSNPTGGTGTPLVGYNTPNQFNLHSGDAIASSGLPTDYTRMTVSYVSNINSSQSPGVYTTTFTYLAVAQF